MAQLARWLVFIEQFDFDVLHRPGWRHGNADGRSRKPVEFDEADGMVRGGCGDAPSDEPEVSPGVLDDSAGEHPGLPSEPLADLQLLDPEIGPIVRLRLQQAEKPDRCSHSVRLRRCFTDSGCNLSLWTACCIDVGAARKVSLLCFSYWYLLHFVMISSAELTRACVVDI